LSFKSPKSCLIMQLMVLGAIFISQGMIFCFRKGFWLILDLTALITCGVQTTQGRPDLLWSLTQPISKNNFTVRYTKTRVIFNNFINIKGKPGKVR
jgi:hypothetical protein